MTTQTDRLILRQWGLEDFEPFAAMLADPKVMQFIAVDSKPLGRFQAWQAFSGTVGHWQLRKFGMFAVIEKGSGQFVGRVGPWHPEGWPGIEIGWTIRSEFWGRGYATEAARRAIEYTFNELGCDRIMSFVEPTNVRSVRVAERVSEQPDGNITLPHVPDRVIVKYVLDKAAWSK